VHAAVRPDKCQDLRADRDTDAKTPQLVFNNLCHVRIGSGKDLGFALVEMDRFAEGLKAFRHLQTDVTCADDRNPPGVLKSFIDADGILKIDQAENVEKLRSGNVRKFRL